jgi:hypothetical protein
MGYVMHVLNSPWLLGRVSWLTSGSASPHLNAGDVRQFADLPKECLTRGQIGTVVERLSVDGEETLLVEFSDKDGQAYAIVPVEPEQLLLLHQRIHCERIRVRLPSTREPCRLVQ